MVRLLKRTRNQKDDATVVKKRRKFGIVEIIFIVGIGLILFGGIYLLATKYIFPAPITAQNVTGQKISIPAGWEVYTSKEYGFSIAHPSYFKAQESVYDLPSNDSATATKVFGVTFKGKANDLAPLGVNLTGQPLDKAVAYAKSNIASYPASKAKLTITKEENLTVLGHKAVRIDVHRVDATTKKETDFTNVYVEANSGVYNIATQLSGAKAFDTADAQTMYKSFAILDNKK